MSDRRDGFQLPTVESVDAIPVETLPAQLAALAALQTRIAARLTLAPMTPSGPATVEGLLDVHDAARRLAVTEDWLRRRPELPFVVKLSGGVVRYSSRGIDHYIAARVGRAG
jgi:hypothetical protein